MGSFVVYMARAVTALLSGSFPTLETTDFLQDREAAGRSVAVITKAIVALAIGRDDTFIRAGASLDLGEGDLQTGQRMFFVFVLLSVVPGLVLKSCRVTEVTERILGDGGRCSLRLKVNRQVGRLFLGELGECRFV